ncbi:hypothetical protein K474DRAFT_366734 [Panus rudis PR-1116 ss-1]|nr:hypothetical protein K474DRAFT_366734 [Panus rudis PR-1116 ss-1]
MAAALLLSFPPCSSPYIGNSFELLCRRTIESVSSLNTKGFVNAIQSLRQVAELDDSYKRHLTRFTGRHQFKLCKFAKL